IRVDDDDETVIDLPEGPAPGATPEEIIEGFIRAGRGPQDRYSVAREYLTEGFAAEWNPTEQVRISSSSIRPEALDEGGYAVTMSVSAVIDGDGRYTQQSSQQTLIFQVVLEDGEYRISSAPAGTT